MQSSPHVNDLRELKAKLSANKRITACIVMIMMVILNMAIGNDTMGDVSSDDDDDDDDDGDDEDEDDEGPQLDIYDSDAGNDEFEEE